MKRTAEEEKKDSNRVQRLCYNARNCLKEQDCGIDWYSLLCSSIYKQSVI